jgi:hypothetical protein
MKLLKVTTLAAASLCALGLGNAKAANVNFIENGDVVTVTPDANFECGFQYSVNGETAHADACWITNSPPGYAGAGDAYMVEPLVPGLPAVISDKLHVEFNVGPAGDAQMSIDFVSDSENDPPEYAPAGWPVLEENGLLQNVNGIFVNAAGAPMTLPANITIYVQSDLDPTVGVEQRAWQNVKALYR